MKVQTRWPVKYLIGTSPGKDPYTYSVHRGLQVARRKPVSQYQATPDQLLSRAWFRYASTLWGVISPAYVKLWEEFSLANPERILQNPYAHTAQTYFTRVHWYRKCNQVGPYYGVPKSQPSFFIKSVDTFEFDSATNEFSFRLYSTLLRSETGFYYFRVAGPYNIAGRRPRQSEYRSVPALTGAPVLRLQRPNQYYVYTFDVAPNIFKANKYYWLKALSLSNLYRPGSTFELQFQCQIL